MRKTLNLDAEAHRFAVAYAKGKGITMSVAINELIRRAVQLPESGGFKTNERGYLMGARAGDLLTPETVKKASEDEFV